MSADTGARERPTKPLFRDRIRAALSHDPERLADFDALCQWEDELLDFTTDLVTRTDAAGAGVPPDAGETYQVIDRMIHELQSTPEPERDYRVIVNAQIATLGSLKRRLAGVGEARPTDTCDECAKVNVGPCPHVGEARPAEPAASAAETMKGQLP